MKRFFCILYVCIFVLVLPFSINAMAENEKGLYILKPDSDNLYFECPYTYHDDIGQFYIGINNVGNAATPELLFELETGDFAFIAESGGTFIQAYLHVDVKICLIPGLKIGSYTDTLILTDTATGEKYRFPFEVEITRRKIAVGIIADYKIKSFQEQDPEFTYHINCNEEGYTPQVSEGTLRREPGELPGKYAIIPEGFKLLNDLSDEYNEYYIKYVNALLTIEEAPYRNYIAYLSVDGDYSGINNKPVTVYTPTDEDLISLDGVDWRTSITFFEAGKIEREYRLYYKNDNYGGSRYYMDITLKFDTTGVDPEVTADGMKVNIYKLYGINDLFISRGAHNAYRACADNKIVRATSAKLAGGYSWTYIVPQPGDYTLCVRYADGSQKFVHFTTEAAIPEFFVDGLDVHITNLTGAKVVRMAKGNYATAGEVKRGENAKGFTPKTFNYADEYTFRFADEGQYTVAVQYDNGYTHIEHVTLTKKTPTFTVTGGDLTISGLDGLYVIRYAEGEFGSIHDIKYTAGSKVIRPAAVADGSVTVCGLQGVYTFAVQYTDGTVFVKTLKI